jgi:CheY-like chemotaxis protein
MSWRVLAVDDEPVNLEIIAEALADLDCEVDRAGNGEEAWLALTESPAYDLIILDRMMPELDGLTLLRRIKGETRFHQLPVIMQTAAAAPEQVRDGVEAGAYYYLTKPYDPQALLAIVRAALTEVAERQRGLKLEAGLAALSLATHGDFEFRDLDQAKALATLLSSLCVDPTAASIGLAELMVNAVEHGNLDISYDDKLQLRLADAWEEEVARRLAAPQWRGRMVHVSFERVGEQIKFTIVDQGKGFDAAAYLDFDPARACDPNGRGIAMARKLCFPQLEFVGGGSTVVAYTSAR